MPDQKLKKFLKMKDVKPNEKSDIVDDAQPTDLVIPYVPCLASGIWRLINFLESWVQLESGKVL